METIVSNVGSMLLNPLFNRPTCFPNIGDTIGARNKVDSFRAFRINRVLNRSRRILNVIKRFEWSRDINLPKNMGNPIRGSMDIWEMNLKNRIHTSGFNSRRFASFVKGLEA